MKPAAFAYHAPGTLAEALDLLAASGHEGKVLAGGQSLVPMMNFRLVAPAVLVDITRIEGLDRVDTSGGAVRVGASVTHEHLRRHQRAKALVPLLSQALEYVAHPAIRHRGTTVGSIVHADPAAEMPAVLTLLGGQIELASVHGTRKVAVEDFFVGPLEADVLPGEIAIAVEFPELPPSTSTAFIELARRHGDYALVGVASQVTREPRGTSPSRERAHSTDRLAGASVALTGVHERPVMVGVDDLVAGSSPRDLIADDELATAIRTRVDEAIEPADDVHATGDYRRHLAGVLTIRALRRASGDGDD